MASPLPHLRAGLRALDGGLAKQAIVHFTRALAADGYHVESLSGIARAYRMVGRRLDALKALDRVIRTGRATVDTWTTTGEVLGELGEWAQALGAFERALRMNPGSAQAQHQFAMAAYKLGEVDVALRHMREAADSNPEVNSLVSLATLIPGAPGATQGQILETRRELARRLAADSPLAGRERPGPFNNPRPRVGYLSSHFHGENYMKPVWALVNHHDRSRHEIHLFSDAENPSLEFPGHAGNQADRLHHVGGLSNLELAEFIAAQHIDVLVDLSAYSTPARLELFVSPLAPVVVAWFNSYATSGLPGIDVIVGDDETVRPEEEKFYLESVRRLPLSYLTFEVTHAAPPVVPPPCLTNGYLTFGSLVTQYKIVPEVIDAWSEILRGAPEARLLLANSLLESKENARWLRQRFADRGIDPERLTLLPPADHGTFLRYYDQIDLALDAFPYNGGTTTMEAIWQGVPVLTFDGDRWASRTSQTLLRRCHLAEFAAESVEAMISRARTLAENPATPGRLAELRSRMRERLVAEPVCDGAALAQSMEALYAELLESA